MARRRKCKYYLLKYKNSWEPKEKLPDVSKCEELYYSNRDRVKVEIGNNDDESQTPPHKDDLPVPLNQEEVENVCATTKPKFFSLSSFILTTSSNVSSFFFGVPAGVPVVPGGGGIEESSS